jgi:hypothetical protein
MVEHQSVGLDTGGSHQLAQPGYIIANQLRKCFGSGTDQFKAQTSEFVANRWLIHCARNFFMQSTYDRGGR